MAQRLILIVLGLLAQVLGLPADQSDPTQWGEIGIATLVSGVALPLAVSHQAMAALLLAAVVVTAHRLGEDKT